MWSLLNAVYKHNRAVETSGEGKMVESMLMSPLATGTGFVSEERWASQLCLAIKHFIAATDGKKEEEDGKQRTTWPEAYRLAHEVAATWKAEEEKRTWRKWAGFGL